MKTRLLAASLIVLSIGLSAAFAQPSPAVDGSFENFIETLGAVRVSLQPAQNGMQARISAAQSQGTSGSLRLQGEITLKGGGVVSPNARGMNAVSMTGEKVYLADESQSYTIGPVDIQTNAFLTDPYQLRGFAAIDTTAPVYKDGQQVGQAKIYGSIPVSGNRVVIGQTLTNQFTMEGTGAVYADFQPVKKP